MSNTTLSLPHDLREYLLAVSLREAPVLKRLRERTAADSMSRMQIAPEQGQFMALLVQLMGAQGAGDRRLHRLQRLVHRWRPARRRQAGRL